MKNDEGKVNIDGSRMLCDLALSRITKEFMEVGDNAIDLCIMIRALDGTEKSVEVLNELFVEVSDCVDLVKVYSESNGERLGVVQDILERVDKMGDTTMFVLNSVTNLMQRDENTIMTASRVLYKVNDTALRVGIVEDCLERIMTLMENVLGEAT